MTDIESPEVNVTLLAEGNTVTLIEDIKLKTHHRLEAWRVIKNIHLTDDASEIEGPTDRIKGFVLRTEFLKKT